MIVGVLIVHINAAVEDPATENHNKSSDHHDSSDHGPPPEIKVAKFDFAYVGGPLTIIVWILIASLAKLGKLVCVKYNWLAICEAGGVSISNLFRMIKISFLNQ